MENNEQAPDAKAATESKKKKGIGVNFKVSAKGAVSVYGLGRFPVTLYREQWLRLLERTDDLRRFLDEHADELKAKGEAGAAEGGATTGATGVAEGEPLLSASGGAPGVPEGAPILGASGEVPSDAGDTEQAVTPDDAGGNETSAGSAVETSTTVDDAGAGALDPGSKTVDATGDTAYGDDYTEAPTDPYRPGNPPGADPKDEPSA